MQDEARKVPGEFGHVSAPVVEPEPVTQRVDFRAETAKGLEALSTMFGALALKVGPTARPATVDERKSRMTYLGLSHFGSKAWALCDAPSFVSQWRGTLPSGVLNPIRRGPSVLFIGPTGAGKTHVAIHLFWNRTLGDRRTKALAISTLDLEAMHVGKKDRDWRFSRARETDLLLLDDVGSETLSYGSSEVGQVVHERDQRGLETWITTGLDRATLTVRYGAQIAARIADDKRIVNLGVR